MGSVGILSDPGQYAKTMRLNYESWLVGGCGARAVCRETPIYLQLMYFSLGRLLKIHKSAKGTKVSHL